MTEANIRGDARELPARVRLRRYIEALGGTLEITAERYPGTDVTPILTRSLGTSLVIGSELRRASCAHGCPTHEFGS